MITRPDADGKEETRVITGVLRVVLWTRQGMVPMDLLTLDAQWCYLGASGKYYLLHERQLSQPEAEAIQRERQEAVECNDATIPCLFGCSWTITGAFGESNYGGVKHRSQIQMLSWDKEMSGDNLDLLVPQALLDGQPHDYFDMMANDSENNQVLFAFYSGGRWCCFIGRELTRNETYSVKVV